MLESLKRNETLFALCVTAVLTLMGAGLISPVLPQYAKDFGVSITMVGLLITIFGLARFALNVPAGMLTEKLGRRPILIAGPLLLVISSVACGLANSYWILLAFRFVQGMGSAIFTTAAMIMLADISTPSNRGQVMSLFQGSMLLGAGLGPTLGGFVAQYFGMRAPFFAFSGLAMMAVLWAFFRLRETSPPERQSAPENPNPAPAPPTAERKSLLGNVNFLLAASVSFGVFFMYSGSQMQLIPLLGDERIGLAEGRIGIALTFIPIMQFATILFGGKLSDRFGRKAVITPGCLIAAASLAMLAQSYSYWLLILSCIVAGIGLGISGPIPAAYVADILPRERISSGMGLYRSIADFGTIIGPVLLGWLADIQGFSFALLFNGGLLLVIAVLFQTMAREPSRQHS